MAEVRTKPRFVLTLKGIDILPVGSTPGVHRLIGVVGGGTFETSAPKYDWINRGVGLGLGRPVPGGVVYEVFELV